MKLELWIYWDTRYDRADVNVVKLNLTESYNSYLVFMRSEVVEIPAVKKPDIGLLNGKLVANLEGQKSTIQADAHMKIKALDEKIQELLCLEAK